MPIMCRVVPSTATPGLLCATEDADEGWTDFHFLEKWHVRSVASVVSDSLSPHGLYYIIIIVTIALTVMNNCVGFYRKG